jgi:hypothetical protein
VGELPGIEYRNGTERGDSVAMTDEEQAKLDFWPANIPKSIVNEIPKPRQRSDPGDLWVWAQHLTGATSTTQQRMMDMYAKGIMDRVAQQKQDELRNLYRLPSSLGIGCVAGGPPKLPERHTEPAEPEKPGFWKSFGKTLSAWMPFK